MRIAVGANHSGCFMRAKVIEVLKQLGHEVLDAGVFDSKPVDYPDIAALVAGKVSDGEVERGILLGGTGMGMCIAANKVAGIRAVVCHDDVTAEISRRHNDSNVLCLSAHLLGESLIHRLVETWLAIPFDGDQHIRRLEKISLLERKGA
jgi:ribose 5-phosphate isomerase B